MRPRHAFGTLIATIAVAAVPSAASATTDPAYPGSTLDVSVSGPLAQEQPLAITGTGTNAAQEYGGSYDFSIILVNPGRLPGPCRASYNEEAQAVLAVDGAGTTLTAYGLNEGSSGPFSITQPYSPPGYGPLLVCGYSQFGFDDAAYASTTVQIAPPAPTAVRPPRITRSGRRLACSRGRWTAVPGTRYSHRWRVGRRTLRSDRLAVRGLRGRRVTCTVTARNAGGSASATSRPYRVR